MKNVINKNTILALMVIGMMCFWGSMNANAQQFNIQGDLVSSYVWRGMYQTGASIQPTLGFSVGNFSLTAWGSTDFDGTSASAGAAAKEIDLTVAYTLGRSGLTVSVADLWWAGQGARKYLVYHETFPLSVAWYTMFAGQDKNAEGGQNYSSYVEFNYPFRVRMVDLNVTCGMVPYAAPQYNCDGFAVTNVALKGTTQIRFTDKFALPVFAQAVWNPRMEDAHLVFGITLKP